MACNINLIGMRTKKKNNSKEVPIYHIVQEFLNSKKDLKACARKAAILKYRIPSTSLNQSLDYLFRITPFYKQALWGNIFPRNISELGEGNSFFFKSENIFDDFNWLLYIVGKNNLKIVEYIHERDLIERDILLGYYDDAINRLETIRKKLGVSIWYYEMKLLIYSYSGYDNKCLELLTEINTEKKDSKHGFVCFLLSYLYKRCSKSYSAFAFDSELENKFRMNRSDFQKDRYIYYLFRLNFYTSYQSKDLTPILIMEATNSLIDRYNILVNILKASFVNSTDVKIKRQYSQIASRFYKKTNDSQLSSLVAFDNKSALSGEYVNCKYIKILDEYFMGDYEQCASDCKDYLLHELPCFGVAKMYCSSLILEGKPFSSVCGNIDSIINQICRQVYITMTKVDYEDEFTNLYQINKNIYGLSIANGLNYYLCGDNDILGEQLYYLSLTQYDPQYCNLFYDVSLKEKYLEFLKELFPESLTIKYQTSLIGGNADTTIGIAQHIIDIDKAKLSFVKQEYGIALALWQSVFNNNETILPIAQEATEYVFRCFECLGQKQEAISFYVESYLKGKGYVAQIDTAALNESLYKEKYKKSVKSGLDLQLFVFLNAKEEERKSAVLERFCSYKDVIKVSDLIPILEGEPNKKKVELYLYMLASEDILRHMLYITSTKMMLEEQQIIAQYLTSFSSSPNINRYISLNQELLDSMIVFQNIKKIDESKIFVNQSSLMKYDLKEHEGLYNQFKIQLANTGSSNTYLIVDSVSDWTDVNKDDSLIGAKVKFTNKAFIDSACQVFTVVRSQFLYSKFGLKTYLSTRIRHGVLEGVLRSGYDALHLLLSTENNRYIPITYWKRTFALTPDEQDALMKVLEKFSKGLNNAIDGFKEYALQIKLEDEDKGLFDYRISADDMCFATVWANTKSSTYEEFCYLLMEYLLQMTNKNLVEIRRTINTSLKCTINTLVDVLEQDIQLFSNKHFFNDLIGAVNNARAETIQKLANVEKWFYLQDAKFENFSLVQQMHVVWTITQKMYPNIKCNVNFKGEENDIKIKAAYFIHISDMLTIFYNNMFSYSKAEECREFGISVSVDNSCINITFENNIKEKEDVLNARFKEMLRSDSRLQLEGKSGLVKVKKIIKDELACSSNQLDVIAENGLCKASVCINMEDICVKDDC